MNTETRYGFPVSVKDNLSLVSRPRMRGWISVIVLFQSGQNQTFLPFPWIFTEPVAMESQVRSSMATWAASVARAPEL